jgi:alkanesulfonate monooxygenase SsuD/methylene tetrahydromethanopterin reductase-like flavin-dependent oxidoreductase (luciferase family)
MSALGAPMSERRRRTDDYIAAMRALWTEPGPVSFESPSYRFAGIDAHPRPVQEGGPRIIVGGHTPAAYRRAVQSGHGWYGFAQTPDGTAACLAGLQEAARAVDRPAALGPLEISVTPRGRLDAAALDAFAAAGVDRLVMNTAGAADADTVAERMRAAAALV